MLSYKKITMEDDLSLPVIEKLYETAFPPNERGRGLNYLVNDKQNVGDLLAFFDGNAFVGFASILTCLNISHVIYFAVAPDKRDEGYGSRIINTICDIKKNYKVIVDVEDPAEERAKNRDQRVKRLDFYEKNGFVPTEIKYRWQHGDYLILSRGGSVSHKEFDAFWQFIDDHDRDLEY